MSLGEEKGVVWRESLVRINGSVRQYAVPPRLRADGVIRLLSIASGAGLVFVDKNPENAPVPMVKTKAHLVVFDLVDRGVRARREFVWVEEGVDDLFLCLFVGAGAVPRVHIDVREAWAMSVLVGWLREAEHNSSMDCRAKRTPIPSAEEVSRLFQRARLEGKDIARLGLGDESFGLSCTMVRVGGCGGVIEMEIGA